MADDRVQRFLSKADWTSLFAAKPQAQKLPERRLTIKRVTFEDSKDSKEGLQERTPDEEIDMKAKMLEIEQRKARYAALRQRLKSLSQPKPTNRGRQSREQWDEIGVGPADYDTRLDIAKPTFLSTRPNNPAPKIRKSAIGLRLTSPRRHSEFRVHTRLVTKSETPTTQPSGKLTPKRSSSMCKNRKLKKDEKMNGSFGARKRSLCRESEGSRGLEFMGAVILPDIRNYTPTPLETHKGKYSIPKSQKRFNIRKCNISFRLSGEPAIQHDVCFTLTSICKLKSCFLRMNTLGNMGCIFGRPIHGDDIPRTHSRPMLVIGASTLEEVRLAPGVFIKVINGSFLHDYEIRRLLGSGSFGKVYESRHCQSGIIRAVKEISKEDAVPTDGERTKFIKEVEILAKVDHPNIAKVFELYEDDYKFAVVSEFVGGGELFSYIVKRNHLTECMAASVMTQILSALRYLHKCDIVHRDLKPENILLDKEPVSQQDINIKIIDFGASASSTQNLHEIIGSVPYLAPEVLKKNYNEKCDLWSAGCILYILLSGTMPFFGDNETVTKYQIENSEPQMTSQSWKSVSSEAKNFVSWLLAKDPVKRPSAEEALSHVWIQKNSYSRVETSQVSLAIDNLKKFCGGSKLQQAVSLFITTYVLTRDEKQHLTDIFNSLDTDHNGVVTTEELLKGLSRRMSLEEAKAQVETIMKQVDMDKSGTINYTEFVAVSISMNRQLSNSALEQAFHMIDTDHSGKIDVTELKSLLGKGLITDEALWTTLINSADQNQDGGIDIDEFMKLMQVAYE